MSRLEKEFSPKTYATKMFKKSQKRFTDGNTLFEIIFSSLICNKIHDFISFSFSLLSESTAARDCEMNLVKRL